MGHAYRGGAKGNRCLAMVCVALITVLLGVGGTSWACVLQPFVILSPSGSGPPKGMVTVSGQRFPSSSLEVRWNSVDGQLLATTAGSQFSVAITVPDVPSGVYSIVILDRTPDGSVGSAVMTAEYIVLSGNSLLDRAIAPSGEVGVAHAAGRGWKTNGWVVGAVGVGMLLAGVAAGRFGQRTGRGRAKERAVGENHDVSSASE